MAHLGADVAAYVDGQMPEATAQAASEHLTACDECRAAVRQQRLLKSRMSTGSTPEPPAELLAMLSRLSASPPPREPWWERLLRAVPLRVGVVFVSASLAVIVTAYAVGGPDGQVGDAVTPDFDRYAANFYGVTAVQAGRSISDETLGDLDDAGWPCHRTLAGDLHRVSASFADGDQIVALSYTDGTRKLNLFEQNGVLDRSGLGGFTPVRMGTSDVWIHRGSPMLVTWDDAGVVFTIVTDVGQARVARALADLPSGTYDADALDRVGAGLSRMTSWLHAA